MEEESESPCPVPACLSPGPSPVSPRLRWGCSVLWVSPCGPWEPERDVETEEGPPWVTGLAQLLTTLDLEVKNNQGFFVSPLPILAPTWTLQEIADTTSGDKSSLETRFMMILCTRSYPHLRRGEAQLPPLPRQREDPQPLTGGASSPPTHPFPQQGSLLADRDSGTPGSGPGCDANSIIEPWANSPHLLRETRVMSGIKDGRWLLPPRPTLQGS